MRTVRFTTEIQRRHREHRENICDLCASSVSSVLKLTSRNAQVKQQPRPRRYAVTRLLIILTLAPNVTLLAQANPTRLSKQDEAFLIDLEQRSFRYFWEQADPQTGLILDRAHIDGTPPGEHEDSYHVASSAATGFGLTAVCIAARNGWLARTVARARVRATSRLLSDWEVRSLV